MGDRRIGHSIADHPITRSPDRPIARSPDRPITRSPDHPIADGDIALLPALAQIWCRLRRWSHAPALSRIDRPGPAG
jgi:hypothetical protein